MLITLISRPPSTFIVVLLLYGILFFVMWKQGYVDVLDSLILNFVPSISKIRRPTEFETRLKETYTPLND